MSDIDKQLEELNTSIQKDESSLNQSYDAISKIPQATDDSNWWSATEAMTISSVLLVFFLIVLCLATYLIKLGRSPEMVMKFFGTILIIAVASFLVVAGYDDKQIAPVIGLLGTIAGYLLGKENRTDEEKSSNKSTNTDAENGAGS
ncbi:hypothetical protein HR060_09485 [Catenovulum sp. SM1970]|uniref:hypothetical protein n=1 Tax=Marinifaba aquimaris TaxID=2741323 RepID=UPI00157385EE|nr:hypothetical protein [Marinifaba aquimaris]NTS77105.1 hypothetical protein [Marinifaba aquimaris]